MKTLKLPGKKCSTCLHHATKFIICDKCRKILCVRCAASEGLCPDCYSTIMLEFEKKEYKEPRGITS